MTNECAEIDEILARSAAIRRHFNLLMEQNHRIRAELFEVARNSYGYKEPEPVSPAYE